VDFASLNHVKDLVTEKVESKIFVSSGGSKDLIGRDFVHVALNLLSIRMFLVR